MELKNVKIKRIGKIETFGDNGFKVIKFVVETTDEQYPQTLELQCTQEKADNLVKFNKVGDVVDCSINLRGREWTNPQGEVKTFNTIEAWKVFKSEVSEIDAPAFQEVSSGDLKEVADDLPF